MVTDIATDQPVEYKGILPDLFREGQGVVTEGALGPGGAFIADTVLAKHDENYMPPEVAEKLREQGYWPGRRGCPMIAELGHFATLLALTLAVMQGSPPLWGSLRNDARLMDSARSFAIGQFVFVSFAFACLVTLYVRSDFSVLNVWQNSHSAKPLLYKITGAWGNHEGSMLLWVLILAFFGVLVAVFSTNLPVRLRAHALSVQGWISIAFLLFILATSNPFARLDPVPFNGQDLNPILQDISLAIHPRHCFTRAMWASRWHFHLQSRALIEGKIDAAWARWVRPWTLIAWMFLTAGISMGSWWAYYELGWCGLVVLGSG